jgi:hypothetical protein
MFGHKGKRAAAADKSEAVKAAFRTEVERLEALSMAELAAEVLVKGFGAGRSGRLVQHSAASTFKPEGACDVGLDSRLSDVVAEGLQVLEHQSLICVHLYSEVYALTRRGRAVLEAGAVEQALRGVSAESA